MIFLIIVFFFPQVLEMVLTRSSPAASKAADIAVPSSSIRMKSHPSPGAPALLLPVFKPVHLRILLLLVLLLELLVLLLLLVILSLPNQIEKSIKFLFR